MESLTDEDPCSIGGYELRARLGQGGFGKVYLGLSPGGRAVAVKVLRPELGEDREFLHRFRQEVAAAQRVNGLYTAHVVAAGLNERRPWVATAFVSGPSLERAVALNGPLPEAAVWRLLAGLVEALQAIHACGLVHRDLKPENVLLAADGPRVIDFGISKSLDGTAVTGTGMIVGTPSFMAPEQADGNVVGPESDIFSLGCVLAYAASGMPPFGGGSYASVLFGVVYKDPVLDGVPDRLRAVIERCLAKAPQARPTLADLAKIGRDGPAGAVEQSSLAFWPSPVAQLIRGFEGRLDNGELTGEPDHLPVTVEDLARPGSGQGEPAPAYPPLPLPSDSVHLGIADPPWPTPATVRRLKAGGQHQRKTGGQQRGRAAAVLSRARGWAPVLLTGLVVLAAIVMAVRPGPHAETSVPRVNGEPRAQAVERIDAAGLKPAMVRRIDPHVGSGLVISTKPASGSAVKKGQAVTVYLSAGPAVPVVRGLTWPRAATRIKAAGLVPAEHKEASSTVRAGDVIGTRPAGGDGDVARGRVTVDVSTGPASLLLPDVVGAQATAAQARLLNLGFRDVQLVTDPRSAAASGEVDQMSPAPGRYQRSQLITLYVSAGGYRVPGVVGDTGAEASAVLRADGFTVRATYAEAPAGQAVAPGAVYSQTPAGGVTRAKGTVIQILVEPTPTVAPVPSSILHTGNLSSIF